MAHAKIILKRIVGPMQIFAHLSNIIDRETEIH